MRKHTNDHPFSCDECQSKFTTSSSMKKHKRIHSGEKPYGLYRVLGNVRFLRQTIRRKINDVINGRPFINILEILINFMTIVTGCTYCPLRFTALGTLKVIFILFCQIDQLISRFCHPISEP